MLLSMSFLAALFIEKTVFFCQLFFKNLKNIFILIILEGISTKSYYFEKKITLHSTELNEVHDMNKK